MCRVLKISRAAYYKHMHRKKSKWEKEDDLLKNKIYFIYKQSKCIYGAPKIRAALILKGFKASLKRVQRLMRKMNIKSVVIKKWRPFCKTKNKVIQRKNLIKQNFSASTINEKWLTDITYIYTKKDGWCYLASVFDCYSAKIVGYSFSKKMDVALALQAVKNALINQKPSKELILHSDLGSQYTSSDFEKYIKNHNILHSFSRKGCPYDNAPMESFHSVLKKEESKMNKYMDFHEAQIRLFQYIEGWYNRKRINGRINFLTPQQCEDFAQKAC